MKTNYMLKKYLCDGGGSERMGNWEKMVILWEMINDDQKNWFTLWFREAHDEVHGQVSPNMIRQGRVVVIQWDSSR